MTVVFNEAGRLQKTIDSVLGQTYRNIEYIIKDGGSTDGTIEVIKEAAELDDRIKYVSTKDNGIYDAMNMSLRLVTGDYINFLNAGDRYAGENVLRRTAAAAEASRALILYGDIIYENPDGTTDLRRYGRICANRLYYLTGDCINHQAMFAASRLFRRNAFDISYKICADREWMMRIGAYSGRMKMCCLGFPVAYYPLDGISVINKNAYKAEAARCIRQHMPEGYVVFAVFEFFRGNELLGKILHGIYKLVFMR